MDTPHVKVRVERCLVLRDTDGMLRLLAKCHGSVSELELPENTTEDGIAALEVFRG
jgi:hypothetical protein